MSLFQCTSVPVAGQRVRGFVAVCGRCGVQGSVAANSFKRGFGSDSAQEETFVGNKFTKIGWIVGKNAAQHRCPGCFGAIRNANAAKKREAEKTQETGNVVKMHPEVKPVADEPRAMEREDRRIVFEKLNEVYVDDKVGYGPGWTDSRVSTDLGVPKAWVKTVRDEMFGPEGSNEEIRATIGEARGLLDEIKKVGAQAEVIVSTLRDILGKADKIEKTVLQIEKEVR